MPGQRLVWDKKTYRSRCQRRRELVALDTEQALRFMSRRSLKEMLAEAAANTAAIKVDEEPRAI